MTGKHWCRVCDKEIHGDVHCVRIILTNAIPGPTTDIEADFHHACAADVFNAFNGVKTKAIFEFENRADSFVLKLENALDDLKGGLRV